ncbi:tRNA pseudouridine synthase B [Austwickia sp. TVS 96-490-7B]|uniref:tRNA pseudouridine(55) synthase TruB n=1 Tax=Austwickia sp. TVS 96-490-7B TaxID=2830843 RepID=UPI001C56790B|nr:tRNA pseudouridine(55) synthase TruB [Austwickia sp. TVS 96-490-7B]MBW3084448.1 tRNA pseudouridine synthase B [Austwickia sp. TVS 96-490-7B]
MPRPADPLVGDGLLLVDKPAGMTSHDVVGACRRICGTRKVGHAGTLDPMATGLLLIGVNKATRLLTFLVGQDKTYDATIRLGMSTVTDDAEGEPLSRCDAAHCTDDDIARAVAALTGELQQVPSSVSAIKVDGVRSYARVRGGDEVALAARAVRVERFDLLARHDRQGEDGTTYVDLDVQVHVSSGTYVRALARDLGEALGVGGHLTRLRRVEVGPFHVDQAQRPSTLEQARLEAPVGTSGLPLLSPAEVACGILPVRRLDEESARLLTHGVQLTSEIPGRGLTAACAPSGELVAVIDEGDEKVSVKAVFAKAW